MSEMTCTITSLKLIMDLNIFVIFRLDEGGSGPGHLVPGDRGSGSGVHDLQLYRRQQGGPCSTAALYHRRGISCSR